jgi:L-alanine-DL-glutamate epimerase-like enolase superfamily enzyme
VCAVIERIEIHPVRIPMQRPFVHAGARRSQTASVLVALDVGNVRGWGEGAPRQYVTGETVSTAMDALGAIEPATLNKLVDLTDLTTAMRDLARTDLARMVGGGEQRMPAAAAALEIALFDLACRLHDRDGLSALRCVPGASALLRHTAATSVAVSFVLDLAGDPGAAIDRLAPESLDAIRHVKLKATADIEDCVRRVAVVRDRFGQATRISVDVNGAWAGQQAVRAARRLRPLGVAWLEEPVAARDWATMREIRESGGVPVMLDESCASTADLDAATRTGAADYVNARISKCGGIVATIGLIAAAAERGIGAQLGVHVGEVGPLWAAARLVSCAVDALVTVEAGKQDEWFSAALTDPAYAVDRRRYVVEPLRAIGIGVTPNETLLEWIRRPEAVGGQQ